MVYTDKSQRAGKGHQ